jgi:hypothetical protein
VLLHKSNWLNIFANTRRFFVFDYHLHPIPAAINPFCMPIGKQQNHAPVVILVSVFATKMIVITYYIGKYV